MALFTKPRPQTTKAAAILLVAILIPSAVVQVAFGGEAGMAFGFAIGVGMATAPVLDRQSTTTSAVVVGMLAGLSTVAHEDPGQVAVLMLVSALLIAITNQRSAGLMTLAPIVVILFGPGPVDLTWMPAMLWTIAGGITGMLIAGAMKFRAPARPVPMGVAWRHAVAIGVISAAAMYWALSNDVPHGYWVAVTVLVALRPLPEERKDTLLGRLLGTLLGAVVALVAIVALPLLPAVIFAAACLFMLVVYSMSGNYFMQTLFLTPMLLVFASLGDTGQGLVYTAERSFYTLVGAAIGAVAAVALSQADRRDPEMPHDPATEVEQGAATGSAQA